MDTALPPLDGLDTEALKALLIEQHAQYRMALSSSVQQIEHLKLMIEKLRRRIFGARSEKIAGAAGAAGTRARRSGSSAGLQ